MVVDELIAVLGYDIRNEAALQRFNKGLDNSERRLHAFAAAAGRVAGGIAAATVAGLSVLAKTSIATGAQFEQLGVRFEALEGSVEKGQKALDWVRDFAQKTPLSLSETAEAYAQLKNFGIDPTNGSLMAATDTMAMAGKGASDLMGITLAMGQAWSKSKLQGQDILQLIDRGVPVWDLLSTAMGKSVQEVQKLSEGGKLGRKEMTLLFEAMGRRAQGASEKMSRTWTGIVGRLGDAWEDFNKQIADAGAFATAKRHLDDFLSRVNSAGGRLFQQRLARNISRVLEASFNSVAAVIDRLMTHIERLSQIKGAKEVLMGIAAAVAALLIYAWPAVAAIAGLLVVLDDIATFFEGGESLTGKIVKWVGDSDAWGLITKRFEEFKQAFADGDWLSMPGLAAGSLLDINVAIASLALDFVKLFDVNGYIDPAAWVAAGAQAAQSFWEGLKSLGESITAWFASLIPPWARWLVTGESMNSRGALANQAGINNILQNVGKTNMAPATGASVVNDNSQSNVNVQAPVTVNVQNATQAPGAVGEAVKNAVTSGANAGASQPSRMQAGPAAQ